ncbi:hypothetical protein [Streptomyces anandii]|uniref:hypothetical protein n=1 Tax=Streptomyces anandii TaxID=285454 RepID=UPI0019CB8DE0|nr:hypothetical protein [Streptomyces anandii]GGX75676.1 hypothetical protein GCM10010510_20430 [Streptomyces anandii JCM 4720]
MRTARTPVAVVVAAFATVGFAAPAAVAKGGDSPGVTWDVGPGGLGNGQFPVGPGNGLGNGQFPGGPGVGGVGGFGGLGGNGQFPGGVGNGQFPGGPGIGPGGGFGNGAGNGQFPGGPGIGPGGGLGNGIGQYPGGPGNGEVGGIGGIGGVGGVGGIGGNLPGEGHGGVPGGIRDIVVAPNVIARGGRLSVAVNGCRTGGNASSPAFSTIPLRPVGGEVARGIATVRPDARPGSYEVRVNCGGRTLVRPNAFTVVGGVRGGVGGGTTTGATRADMAIGGGLVAAGVLGGATVWLRRRSTGRRI